jgi:Glycosyltransferase
VGQAATIKVMLMNSMNIWRGGEVHVFLLCQQLMASGVGIVLACRSGSPLHQKAVEAEIPVLTLPLTNAVDLKSAWTLAHYCRENAIGIIHAHNGRDYWLARWAKVFNPNLRIVITRHILAPLKNTVRHRWLYSKIDKVIAVSQTVKNAITVFPPEKIAVVYNGIDTEKFAAVPPGTLRKDLGLAATTKIVGMVGRINSSKGHLAFLRSVPAIRAAQPDTAFVVVGGGDSSQLKQQAGDVLFLGERSNIPEIMKDMDVFVMASRNEPFGLVTVEAMSSGTPVVAANSGGTAEIITDGETGLLFPPDDPAKLAQAVLKILTDSRLARKLTHGGRSTASRFNIGAMATNTRNVYNDILNKG